MNTPEPSTTWKLTSPSALLVLALAAFLFFIGLRAHLDPLGAASGFGVPVHGTDIVPWLHVKGGRDIGIGLMVVGLLLARQRRALGLLILASAEMPITDALVVIGQGTSVAYALGVHGSAALFGLLLGPWLLYASAQRPSLPAASALGGS